MREWYWAKVGERHYFVEAVNRELKNLVALTGGVIASAERSAPADLEAQIMEEVIPKLEEKLSEKKVSAKYVMITSSLGTIWDINPPRVGKVAGLYVMLYKRKPKWLKEDKVIDYSPTEYEPVKKAERGQNGEVIVDRGIDEEIDEDGLSP